MNKVVMWRVIAVASGIATLLIGYFFVAGPVRNNAADLNERADEQVQTNEKNRQRIAQYEAQAAEVPAKQAQIAEVETAMPATLDQPGLVRAIESEATSAGVTVESVTPGTPAPAEDTSGGAPYLAMPLAITASGSYSQIKTFVNGLEQMERAYLIETMSVADGGEESGALTLDTTGQVFTIPAADLATDGGSSSSSSGTTEQNSAAGKLPRKYRDPTEKSWTRQGSQTTKTTPPSAKTSKKQNASGSSEK